jgi:Zn finger protein HypA/HybF involved in hydrogenase expression
MEEASDRYRPSGGRLAAMVACAVVALAAFLLLWDVRFNHPDLGAGSDPVFGGITDAATRANWTIVLIAVEAMALAAILILLLIHPRGPSFADEAWPAEGWAHGNAPPSAGKLIQIGCPGCGTVFEKVDTEVDEPHEQAFRCPNCGRAGHLRMGIHKVAAIRSLVCTNCSRGFEAYRDPAECPHCHAVQA